MYRMFNLKVDLN